MNLRVIPSHPDYLASVEGHIYSTRRPPGGVPRLLTERPTWDGYMRVSIVRGTTTRIAVAPMVAEAFLGTRPAGTQVRHLDGDKSNNRPENLAYGTAKQNADDRQRHGRTVRGNRVSNARHSDAEVDAALARLVGGESQRSVAAALGVSQASVNNWWLGKTRKRINVYRIAVAG